MSSFQLHVKVEVDTMGYGICISRSMSPIPESWNYYTGYCITRGKVNDVPAKERKRLAFDMEKLLRVCMTVTFFKEIRANKLKVEGTVVCHLSPIDRQC